MLFADNQILLTDNEHNLQPNVIKLSEALKQVTI